MLDGQYGGVLDGQHEGVPDVVGHQVVGLDYSYEDRRQAAVDDIEGNEHTTTGLNRYTR